MLKTKRPVFIVVLFVFALSLGAAIRMMVPVRAADPTVPRTGLPSSSQVQLDPKQESSAVQQPENPNTDYYYLRAYEGQIAIFKGESSEPLEVLDKPLSHLPQAEQDILIAGIYAEDEAALNQLLEDYTS